jgi:nuclear pore complex protein Nup107
MYTSALGDNAVERYALFLTSLALSTDLAERRTALQRAREHRLDVPHVAIITAECSIECVLDSLPLSVKRPLPDLAQAMLKPAEEAVSLLV